MGSHHALKTCHRNAWQKTYMFADSECHDADFGFEEVGVEFEEQKPEEDIRFHIRSKEKKEVTNEFVAYVLVKSFAHSI
jgi:hypothetical protein